MHFRHRKLCHVWGWLEVEITQPNAFVSRESWGGGALLLAQRGGVSFPMSNSKLEAEAGLRPCFPNSLALCSAGLHKQSFFRHLALSWYHSVS